MPASTAALHSTTAKMVAMAISRPRSDEVTTGSDTSAPRFRRLHPIDSRGHRLMSPGHFRNKNATHQLKNVHWRVLLALLQVRYDCFCGYWQPTNPSIHCVINATPAASTTFEPSGGIAYESRRFIR